MVAIGGGRLDHQLANLLALADPVLANAEVRAHTDNEIITIVRRAATLRAKPGRLISLIPVGSDVSGITTSGLTYPLDDETLLATSSRGISNTFSADVATVTVSSGVLLAIENRQ